MLVRAYIDDNHTITILFAQMLKKVNIDEVKVYLEDEEIEIEKYEKVVLHTDVLDEAEKRGYEICDEMGRIRFILKEGYFDFERKEGIGLYVVGDMNNWEISPEWEMRWCKKRKRYELIKDINDVSFGNRFKFAESYNKRYWYPKGYGNDIVISDYQNRDEVMTNKLRIKTAQRLLPYLRYTITFKNKKIYARPRGILNTIDYFYPDELGCLYQEDKCEFRLWAPSAYKINLLLFNKEGAYDSSYTMKRSGQGTWKLIINENLAGYSYLYEVWHHNYDEESGFIVYKVPDPYSKLNLPNSSKTLIFNMKNTQIENWDQDSFVENTKNQTDAIIYEIHIRDFTIDSTTNIEQESRGKFIGFCQEGEYKKGITTALSHLKDLNITHVHLLPVSDFGSVDELNPDKKYNWGYDPVLYQSLEGWFSTNPGTIDVIKEFRYMIKKLHENHIGVILDVVFNHTYQNKGGIFSIFDKIVPEFFYRVDDYGDYSNGSGCGNELATEKLMVRKFIIDTIIYFVENFHIDGFRFDLMGLIDAKTMLIIQNEVRKRNPNAILYGEGWVMDSLLCPIEERMNLDTNFHHGYAIGMFNDRIRDAIRGDLDGFKTGYMHGNIENIDKIRQGVRGAIDDFAKEPTECVNYVSSHDNLSLWDKAYKTMVSEDFYWIDRACRFANGIILTSQGVAFLHGGVEFNRHKKGYANTYNLGDEVNKINWRFKERFSQTFKFYAELIKIRREHISFRMSTRGEIKKYLRFIPSPTGVIAFTISHPDDTWKNIIVAYNPYRENKSIDVGDGRWKIVVEDATIFENGRECIGSIDLFPLSIMIAYKIT